MGTIMHTCSRCTIQVHESSSHCPVCGTFISRIDKLNNKHLYPTPNYPKIRKRQTRLLLSLLAIPFFVGLLLSIGIDILLIQINFSSTMLISYFLFYGYIILFETILKDNTIGTIFLYHGFALLVGIFIFPSLSLNLEDAFRFGMLVPWLLSLLNTVFIIFAWIQRRSHLLLFQMSVIATLSLIYGLVNYSFDQLEIPFLVLLSTSTISLIFVSTFFRKDFLSFLSRWLHI
jgi:predicted nucleic acid-binding Zn ribbon protein